jgi:hypothetical protein
LRVLSDVSNRFATVRGRRKAILFMSDGIDYPMTLAQATSPSTISLVRTTEPWDRARSSTSLRCGKTAFVVCLTAAAKN